VTDEVGGKRGEKYWRELIRQFEKAGLSRSQFCAEHGLKLSTFDYWRRFIRQQDGGVGSRGGSRENSQSERALLPVVITNEPTSPQVIEIRTAQGHVVSVPVAVCPKLLQQVFKALGDL
jgi:hypothetical protein